MSTLLQPGQILAERYRIDRFIAKGGFGAVYAAEQIETELMVALKVLWPHVLQSTEAIEQFKLEARIAGRIRSEHIVRVFDAGLDRDTGMPFLVMELLEGSVLEEVVRTTGPIAPDRVTTYMRQVASALDRAHGYTDRNGAAQPIVHRDLKPENLFLCRRESGEPVVKILDFGIAKVLSATTSMSQVVKGTPLYMAYEQVAAEGVTPATDIWALGLIAFFLLSGRPYWKAANEQDATLPRLFAEVLSLPLDPPSRRAADLGAQVRPPERFDAWFEKCVHRDPSCRFRTAGECATALANVFDEAPHAPLGDGPAPQASRGDQDVSASAGGRPNERAAGHGNARRARTLTVAALVGLTVAGGAWVVGRPSSLPAENPKPVASGGRAVVSAIASAPAAEANAAPANSSPSQADEPRHPRLDVRIPERLREGDILDIVVSSDREMQVLVVDVEEDGTGTVLLPSATLSEPRVMPTRELRLPPLRPALRRRGRAAREQLVTYGFVSAGDFRSAVASLRNTKVDRAFAEIDRQLSSRPSVEWTKTVVSYEIVPK
jgi:serine/threonine-protein kinase